MNQIGISDIEVEIPKTRMTTKELALKTNKTEQYILDKTGLIEKPVYIDNSEIFELAFKAAERIFIKRPELKNEIEVVFSGCVVPDSKLAWYPSTVAINRLGLKDAFGLDIQNGCNSLSSLFRIAKNWLETSKKKAALILVADRLSAMVDYNNDSHSCIYSFSDAASAILIEKNPSKLIILDSIFSTESQFSESNSILRLREKLYFEENEEEDKAISLAYKKNYLHNINHLICAFPDNFQYSLLLNQGDFKLIKYLEKNLRKKPTEYQQTYDKFGHMGNTDISFGLLSFINNSNLSSPDYALAASSGFGYSFSATLFRRVE